MRILYHLHFPKVYDFIEYHYKKYEGDKKTWLNYVYRNLKVQKQQEVELNYHLVAKDNAFRMVRRKNYLK